MVAYLDKKFSFLSRRLIQISMHARRAVISLGKKVLRIYEGWNFNSGNYLFTSDTK